ncbi:MAG TPA: calcium-binding protein, partial [Pirellulaceae bacterium]
MTKLNRRRLLSSRAKASGRTTRRLLESPAGPRCRTQRLALEQLEDRRLLAITANIVGNELRVLGDQNPLILVDFVTLTPVGPNQVEVFDGGLSQGIFTRGTNPGEYQQILISVGADNDVVNINGPNSVADSGKLVIFGGFGDDMLTGNDGGEVFIGGEGSDVMTGERGDDYYIFEPTLAAQIDDVVEQPIPEYGVDTLDFSRLQLGDPVVVDLTNAVTMAEHTTAAMNHKVKTTGGSPLGLEDVVGGTDNDTITGNKWANRITGNDGSDTMYGQEGSDRYIFSVAAALPAGMGPQKDIVKETHAPSPPEDLGVDTLDFSQLLAFDPVIVDLRNDNPALLAQHTNREVRTAAAGESIKLENVLGGAGSDTITGNAAKNFLDGREGNDTLDGDFQDDELVGGPGQDSIAGSDGDDSLQGDGENDNLAGGPGDDTYVFDNLFTDEIDVVAELPNEGNDTLDFQAATIGLNIDLTLDLPIAMNGLG